MYTSLSNRRRPISTPCASIRRDLTDLVSGAALCGARRFSGAAVLQRVWLRIPSPSHLADIDESCLTSAHLTMRQARQAFEH